MKRIMMLLGVASLLIGSAHAAAADKTFFPEKTVIEFSNADKRLMQQLFEHDNFTRLSQNDRLIFALFSKSNHDVCFTIAQNALLCGANPGYKLLREGYWYATPIHGAVRKGYDFLQLILERLPVGTSAEVINYVEDPEGYTPLMIAASKGDVRSVEALLARPEIYRGINDKDYEGNTALNRTL